MINRLRSLLRDYYPQALAVFPNLTHRAAASVLRAAPTPRHRLPAFFTELARAGVLFTFPGISTA
jgi:hypothetical protein